MSEENSPSQEPAANEPAAKPRVRRVSTPRPKKSAATKAVVKSASVSEAPASAPEATVPVASVPPASVPEREVVEKSPKESSVESHPSAESHDFSAASQDWPEPETISEGSSSSGDNKRKRRRRKGKGGQNGSSASASEDSSGQPTVHPSRPQGGQQQTSGQPAPSQPVQSAPQHPQRTSVDPEILAKKAWKIFLSEVSEEGVALISDQDARELSKRCFRLAEIFMDEQGRRIRQ